ncbi:hypothetical protein BD289DRAFT_482150 [Coniella lustricola]|uniref:Chitin synthesis regulation, congo red resistance, RCR protein n=1 Tax=Coniella lustricola TaxID=2025994 RepID=A0A2T3A9W6_9PEZI|nr:hypothetical protein BD289DRAFT_482150 [Coniella lustricola]
MDAPTLVQRQTAATTTEVPAGFVEENGRLVPFWYTRTGEIIKWSVFLGLFVIFMVYWIVGYAHAKRRIRRGQAPMAYHRWLISSNTPSQGYPTYRAELQPQYYNMQPNMVPPPPMYDPAGRPPIYEGPAGGSKAAPSQQPMYRPADEEYGAPAGPPPARTS